MTNSNQLWLEAQKMPIFFNQAFGVSPSYEETKDEYDRIKKKEDNPLDGLTLEELRAFISETVVLPPRYTTKND